MANLRDVNVLLREFRLPLMLFVLLILVGAFLFYHLYTHSELGHELTFVESVYVIFAMIFFGTDIPFPSQWYLQIFFFAMPILGLALIGQGVIGFGVMLFNKRARGEEWQVAIASTYRDHIIVCGLGKVGYRVVAQLLSFGEEVVGIEANENAPFVERVRQMGVPVIIADARQREWLIKAGIERASSIVVCTNDDLCNLDIALDARELKPDIKVVMRMFDGELAKKVGKGFGIHTAFSTSALAAPAFAAAATRANVTHSFYVDDQLLNISEITIQPGSPLAGWDIARLEQEFDMSVILCKSCDRVELHPAGDIVVHSGDKIVVSATLKVLNRLGQANRPPDR